MSTAVKSRTKPSSGHQRNRVLCESCTKKCSGNVLRVQDKYFHIPCFNCSVCKSSLAQGGFFNRDGKYYCSLDYQKLFGTKCSGCGSFVEGEVVTALGNTYHQSCFKCAKCRKPFPPGDKVTFTGKEVICIQCLNTRPSTTTTTSRYSPSVPTPHPGAAATSQNVTSMSKTTSSVSITRHEQQVLNESKKIITEKKEEIFEREEEIEENFDNHMYQELPKSQPQRPPSSGHGQRQPPLQPQSSFESASDRRSRSLSRSMDTHRSEESSSRRGNEVYQKMYQTGQSNRCGECGDHVNEGEALVALDKSWHVYCFKCTDCGQVLDGEYMGKDGLPYCERDYQKSFGVKCIHCDRYITGKVLQAGDNHHFHPTCARCTKCGDPFGDGEEMFMQGGAIWHPRCGPGTVPGILGAGGKKYYKVPADAASDLNSQYYNNSGHHHPSHVGGGVPSSAASRYSSLSSFRSRSVSPSFSRSSYRSQQLRSRSPTGVQTSMDTNTSKDPIMTDLNRVYTYSYLAAIPAPSLKRQIDPRPAKSPQFHRPADGSIYGSSRRSRSSGGGHYSPKRSASGMRVMVESLRSTSPTSGGRRSKSPSMNNEEVLEMAHYPDARKPTEKEVPRIERDDFPAPPFPYTDPERRRRWSESSKENDLKDDLNDDDLENVEDIDIHNLKNIVDDENLNHLKREEEELSKISSGIGKVFLKEVQEREKLRAWKLSHMDPRNASRAPSAKKEIPLRLRYDNPVNASPSRDMDRNKPWEEDPESFEVSSQFRSFGGRSSTLPPTSAAGYHNLASSTRSVPRAAPRAINGRSTSALSKTQSTDYFYSGRSDISTAQSELQIDDHLHQHQTLGHLPINHSISGHNFAIPPSQQGLSRGQSPAFSEVNPIFGPGGARYRGPSYAAHFRRSMPNVNLHSHSNEPAKMIPYHLLITSNYRLPPGVDRCHLERHLSNEEFVSVFNMSRIDFYRLPQWKRNSMKKRARLF